MNDNQFQRMSEWEISRRNAWLNLMRIFLILFQTALFLAVWFNFYQDTMLHPYYYWGNWVMGGVFMVLYTLFARLYGGFQLNISRTSEIIYSLDISSHFHGFFHVLPVLPLELPVGEPTASDGNLGGWICFLYSLGTASCPSK